MKTPIPQQPLPVFYPSIMEIHCNLQQLHGQHKAPAGAVPLTWSHTLDAFTNLIFQWNSTKSWQKNRITFLFPPSPQFKSVPTGGHTWPQGWTSRQIITGLFYPHPTRTCSSLTNIQLKYIHFYLQEEHILNSFALGVLVWFFDFFLKIRSQNNSDFATELLSDTSMPP